MTLVEIIVSIVLVSIILIFVTRLLITVNGLYKKSIQNGNEYVFVNAWNEWGEGNYVEPDTIHGHGFLEAIRKVITH